MRTFLKILAGFIVLMVVAFTAVMFISSGDREIARNFVLLSSSGDYPGAQALMHSALREEFTIARLEEGFAGVTPYTDVSFSSVETSGQGTVLEGTASTADGCSSKVSFEILSERIIAFNITPLCR